MQTMALSCARQANEVTVECRSEPIHFEVDLTSTFPPLLGRPEASQQVSHAYASATVVYQCAVTTYCDGSF